MCEIIMTLDLSQCIANVNETNPMYCQRQRNQPNVLPTSTELTQCIANVNGTNLMYCQRQRN